MWTTLHLPPGSKQPFSRGTFRRRPFRTTELSWRRKAGKTVRVITYPSSPHFPVLWEQRLNLIQELTDWLSRYNK
jgi:hypothetical protein